MLQPYGVIWIGICLCLCTFEKPPPLQKVLSPLLSNREFSCLFTGKVQFRKSKGALSEYKKIYIICTTSLLLNTSNLWCFDSTARTVRLHTRMSNTPLSSTIKGLKLWYKVSVFFFMFLQNPNAKRQMHPDFCNFIHLFHRCVFSLKISPKNCIQRMYPFPLVGCITKDCSAFVLSIALSFCLGGKRLISGSISAFRLCISQSRWREQQDTVFPAIEYTVDFFIRNWREAGTDIVQSSAEMGLAAQLLLIDQSFNLFRRFLSSKLMG